MRKPNPLLQKNEMKVLKPAIFVVVMLCLQAMQLFMAKNMEVESATFVKVAEHILERIDRDQERR